jgi:hypothetical protein
MEVGQGPNWGCNDKGKKNLYHHSCTQHYGVTEGNSMFSGRAERPDIGTISLDWVQTE